LICRESDPELDRDLGCGGRILGHPKAVIAVGDALEQEEAVKVGARGRDRLAGGVDQLEIARYEWSFRAESSFIRSAADESRSTKSSATCRRCPSSIRPATSVSDSAGE
jgi:hypothetical protein